MSWIHKSIKNSKNIKDTFKLHHINFFIKDKLPKHINLDNCIYAISRAIPSHLLKGVDIVYVGKFDFLDSMNFSALYKDGAIYLSNYQEEEQDIINDLLHEVAHSNEHLYSDRLYSDGRIIKEFLGKRKKIFYLIKAEGFKPPESLQKQIDFTNEIDNYLYDELGYGLISTLSNGLFVSPYSVTSMREYFATGFEEYFSGNKKNLKKICPVLYSKIDELNDLEG